MSSSPLCDSAHELPYDSVYDLLPPLRSRSPSMSSSSSYDRRMMPSPSPSPPSPPPSPVPAPLPSVVASLKSMADEILKAGKGDENTVTEIVNKTAKEIEAGISIADLVMRVKHMRSEFECHVCHQIAREPKTCAIGK
jgi:hypothetical protein